MAGCTRTLWMAALLFGTCRLAARADTIDEHLAAIARVGAEGAGSAAARQASEALATLGGDAIGRLLAAMDCENPVAANWYRVAYESIVERELASAEPRLPLVEIQAIVADPAHRGPVRRLALTVCDRLDPGYAERFLLRQLDDAEFRADAVDLALSAGQKALDSGDSQTARTEFAKAFDHARASTQCVLAAEKLAALGQRVDTQAHLGLVADWWLIGPFDAPGFSGFDRPFPPELAVNLAARYGGQEGRELAWKRYKTNDPLGTVNLVEALAAAREAVGYAYAELESSAAGPAEIRCGADDNCTVWLNDEKVFSRPQWLNGTRFDRFVTPVRLKPGKNRLLVKICQGPPNRDPQVPNNWTVQLRFTNSDGDGLPLKSLLPAVDEVSR
jgi:hypothetical protein